MTSALRPEIDAINAPYWEALGKGELHFQECPHCGNRWLPARHACPSCLKPEPVWTRASGAGTLKSWVVYHTAYHPAFENHVPYNVALVELDEGPRLLTNILGDAPNLKGEAKVRLQIDVSREIPLATFVMAQGE